MTGLPFVTLILTPNMTGERNKIFLCVWYYFGNVFELIDYYEANNSIGLRWKTLTLRLGLVGEIQFSKKILLVVFVHIRFYNKMVFRPN